MNKKLAIFLIFLASACFLNAEGVFEDVRLSDGDIRTYYLYYPEYYDDQTPMPLVINLHFGGGNGEAQASVTRMNDDAYEEGFIVCYPDAIGLGWQNLDTLFLSELVDTLSARYAIDTYRVYMTGYSSGALMTHWMACKMSDKLGAVAPVAGTMLTYDWGDCFPGRSISIISFNARNDPAVPYEGDGEYMTPVEEAMSNWAERLGCDQGPDTFWRDQATLRQTWTQSQGDCEVVLWTTEEGDHAWPSQNSAHKLDANKVMWEFFVAHPLPGADPGITEPDSPPDCELDPQFTSLFSRSSTIRFTVSRPGNVCVRLYDVNGRNICALFEGVLDPGEHLIEIDTSELPRGVYFYCLESPGLSEKGNFILVK